MGQNHQRDRGISPQCRCSDALGRLLDAHRTKDRLGGAVEVMPPSGAGRTGSHDSQPRGLQLPQAPAAVQITQKRQLRLKGAATGIAAGVVVAKDAGQWKGHARETLGDGLLAVAEVAHDQKGVRFDLGQNLLIQAVPLAMQISGDGNAEGGQAVPRLPPSCTT